MKTLRELNFVTLCSLYIFGLSLLTLQYLYTYSPAANASILSTLIGGTTKGVSDICCNGVVFEFTSVDSTNFSILSGEAIFVTGISSSYDNGTEYSSGYNVLGNLIPGMCVKVDSDCESAKEMPTIINIGTSGMPSSGI